jgi:hypothetical protein
MLVVVVVVIVIVIVVVVNRSNSSGSFVLPSVLAPKVSYFCPFPIDSDNDDGSDNGDFRWDIAVLALLAIIK